MAKHEFTPIESVIGQSEQLKGLTEEQKSAIAQILGNRIGEIYRDMDLSIAEETGVARNGDEKTYDFLSRASKVIKSGLTDKETALNNATTEIARLKAEIAKGGDEETKRQLQQATADLENMKKSYNELKESKKLIETNHAKELFDVKLESELNAALNGIRFKQGVNEEVLRVAKESAVNAVKGMNPEYFTGVNGVKSLIFRDGNGATLNNPDNNLNPYTASELLHKQLSAFGIIETVGTGAGQKGGMPGEPGAASHTLDLSGCRTQVEANTIISKHLSDKGMRIGTYEYQSEMSKIINENKVFDLPLQ